MVIHGVFRVDPSNTGDVNKDGSSDVPKLDQLVIHPTVFFNPNTGLLLRFGVSSTIENRDGGDIRALKNCGYVGI